MSKIEKISLEEMKVHWDKYDSRTSYVNIAPDKLKAMSKKDWVHIKKELEDVKNISVACANENGSKIFYFHNDDDDDSDCEHPMHDAIMDLLYEVSTNHSRCKLGDSSNNAPGCGGDIGGIDASCAIFK